MDKKARLRKKKHWGVHCKVLFIFLRTFSLHKYEIYAHKTIVFKHKSHREKKKKKKDFKT